jgi:hypothetical protein
MPARVRPPGLNAQVQHADLLIIVEQRASPFTVCV